MQTEQTNGNSHLKNGDTKWGRLTSSFGKEAETAVKNFLTSAYPNYQITDIAEKNLPWDLEVRWADDINQEPCKIDVKHTSCWLNTKIIYYEKNLLGSCADIGIYYCDTFPNGKQFLIIDPKALINCPGELKNHETNPAGQILTTIKYKDLSKFCRENNYDFRYRSINM